ncbi:MAG TPA: hypothetical protein VIM42_08410 [Clostridium sp.]
MNEIPRQWAKQLPEDDYITRLERENTLYVARNVELQTRVDHLRTSRRVLMSLLETAEQEKVALEYLAKRRNKQNRPNNPFEVVVDNSNTIYTFNDIPEGEEFNEERELLANPEVIFKEFYDEEGK